MINTKLNICFVALYAFPLLSSDRRHQIIGGAELQMVVVARKLVARGHQISMICLDFGQDEHVEIDGIQVHRAFKEDEGIPVLRFFEPRLTSIWRSLKAADAELYYQQTAGMLTGVVAHFCKVYKRKSVFASASNPDLIRNTTRIHFARDRWIYNYGLRNVDRIFVQNEEQERLCRTHHHRSSNVVRNCYDVPIHGTMEPGGKSILWVSTIRAIKRPEVFLEIACAQPDLNFKMIGGPDGGNHSLYEKVKKRASLLPNLDFLGFVPFWEIETHFDSAKIIVNTSESEGVPNALLQAWARGIPSVSFVDPGCELEGQAVGRIVADFPTMVSAIHELALDDQLRRTEGMRAKEYVDRFHSSAIVIPEYERLFREICSN